jgi:hypothetical protein
MNPGRQEKEPAIQLIPSTLEASQGNILIFLLEGQFSKISLNDHDDWANSREISGLPDVAEAGIIG